MRLSFASLATSGDTAPPLPTVVHRGYGFSSYCCRTQPRGGVCDGRDLHDVLRDRLLLGRFANRHVDQLTIGRIFGERAEGRCVGVARQRPITGEPRHVTGRRGIGGKPCGVLFADHRVLGQKAVASQRAEQRQMLIGGGAGLQEPPASQRQPAFESRVGHQKAAQAEGDERRSPPTSIGGPPWRARRTTGSRRRRGAPSCWLLPGRGATGSTRRGASGCASAPGRPGR